MHACVRACRVRVAPKCKHGHVLRGNTCRAVPVKINHVPGGEGAFRKKERERMRRGSSLEEIREKGRSSRPLSAGLVLSRAIQEQNEKNEEKDCAVYRCARKNRVPVLWKTRKLRDKDCISNT